MFPWFRFYHSTSRKISQWENIRWAKNVITLCISCLIKARSAWSRGHLSLVLWRASAVASVQLLQLRLQRLEVTDGVLESRVRTQRLQLHEVPADVVETHVSEPTSEISRKTNVKMSLWTETKGYESTAFSLKLKTFLFQCWGMRVTQEKCKGNLHWNDSTQRNQSCTFKENKNWNWDQIFRLITQFEIKLCTTEKWTPAT